MRLLAIAALSVLLTSCSQPPKPVATEAPKVAPPVKPADESRRFPKANLVKTEVVDTALMGKAFMPGGTVAHYRKGKTEYDQFVAKTASANDAAMLLGDWRKALTDAKFVASFGGYAGSDAGTPMFVFAKGPWIAGIKGLSQKDADLEARTLAGAL
jgi:hypothetical protein